MPRRPEPDEDEEDDDFGDEDELPEGVYHDEEPATVACPYCGEQVYEGAQYCGRCENYISKEDAPANSRPTWIWVLLILCLGMMLLGVVGGW